MRLSFYLLCHHNSQRLARFDSFLMLIDEMKQFINDDLPFMVEVRLYDEHDLIIHHHYIDCSELYAR